MRKAKKSPLIDLDCIAKLRREVEKIPPQRNQRAARNLAKLKTAVERLEREARERGE